MAPASGGEPARATFGAPADSPYVLPYAVGEVWQVTQSYCNSSGGHRDTFAYDFSLPRGHPVLAARAGVVILANDQYADDDNVNGHENNVFVLHDDGTVVRYTHLQQGSVTVTEGQSVVVGRQLGLNGSSGNTSGSPHLHFEVFRSRGNYQKSNSLPVNFRNTAGPLDERGGLRSRTSYEALAY